MVSCPQQTHIRLWDFGHRAPTAPEALPEKLDGPGLPCGQHTCDPPFPVPPIHTHKVHTALGGPGRFCLSLWHAYGQGDGQVVLKTWARSHRDIWTGRAQTRHTCGLPARFPGAPSRPCRLPSFPALPWMGWLLAHWAGPAASSGRGVRKMCLPHCMRRQGCAPPDLDV